MKFILKEDFRPDFKLDLHYISWTPFNVYSTIGYSKLSYVYAIVLKAVPDYLPEQFFRMVDSHHETGTLYPTANITIMPSIGVYKDEEIYRHFNDAMKAQNTMIHAHNVIFDMRSYAYINPSTMGEDNGEYIWMINNAYRLAKMLRSEEWYVVMLESEYKRLNLDYSIADEAEIAKLEGQ